MGKNGRYERRPPIRLNSENGTWVSQTFRAQDQLQKIALVTQHCHSKTETPVMDRSHLEGRLIKRRIHSNRPFTLLLALLCGIQCPVPSALETTHQTVWTEHEKLKQTKACILQLRPQGQLKHDGTNRENRHLRRSEYVATQSESCLEDVVPINSFSAGEEVHFGSEVSSLQVAPLRERQIGDPNWHLASAHDASLTQVHENSFRATKSGEYAVLVTFTTDPRRNFRIILVVTSAAAFPANCQACFLSSRAAQITSNASDAEANCTLLDQNDRLRLSLSEGQLGLIPLVPTIVNNTNSTNTTNISTIPEQTVMVNMTTTPIPSRRLEVCQDRSCIALQVLRYDAWDNRVYSNDVTDIIALELEGVEANVIEDSEPLMSGASYDKFETFEESDGVVAYGNNSCDAFACNVSQLVAPEQSVLAWLVVRMNGYRLSLGSPFLVETPRPPLYSFLVDADSLQGRVSFAGGFVLRVFPADRGGTPIDDTWFGIPCGTDDECRNMAIVEAAKFEVVSSFCIQESMKTFRDVEIDFSSILFEPECAGGDLCTQEYQDLNAWNELAVDNTPVPTTTPQPNRTKHPQGQRRAGISEDEYEELCGTNCTWNRRSLAAKINTPVAGHCWMFIKYGALEVFTPDDNLFNGTVLRRGVFAFDILAGLPNETYSTAREFRQGGGRRTVSAFNGTVDPQLSFELALELRDKEANPVRTPSSEVMAKLRNERLDQDLAPSLFDENLRVLRLHGAVTVSGTYQLQIFLAPFAVPLATSPYQIHVAAGAPIAAKSLLLSSPMTVIIAQFGQFFFQARDVYENSVPSSDPFFDPESHERVSSDNNAPGYWIWAVPQGILDDNGDLALPQVDRSGVAILRCPTACNGEDPGFGSFKAAFRPNFFGDYYVEVQYCDPVSNDGGLACNVEPYAYDLGLLQPPVAPNPCTNEVAGEPGGARLGYACTIEGMNFRTSVVPDRIVIPTSEVIIPNTVKVGRPTNITIRGRDRFNRDSGQPTTRCNYTLEFYSFKTGDCTLDAATRTFKVDFEPPFAGEYALTVFLNGQVLNNMPARFAVTTDFVEYSGRLSTATGRGLEEAAVGRLNDIVLHLRDSFGSLIDPVIYTPDRGFPFLRDCGFPFPQLPDGTITSGYGLSGAYSFGLNHGCRLAFHTYIIDGDMSILRPARGFQVESVTQIADGGIRVRYSLTEAAPVLMYVRYLPTSDAGYTLHDPAGRLSLQSNSTSRDGQIRGSPFLVSVSPGIADAQYSRVKGPGLLGAVIDGTSWTHFQIESRDLYRNRGTCRSDEVEVTIMDPDGAFLTQVLVEGGTQSNGDVDCKVWYYPTLVGRHEIFVKFRGVFAEGGPFYPYVTSGPMEAMLASRSFVQLLTETTHLSCYEDYTPATGLQCSLRSRAGASVITRISARDSLGRIPDDTMTSFSVKINREGVDVEEFYSTARVTPGKHELTLVMTVSGWYKVSVPFDAGHIHFVPHSTESEHLFVSPGDIFAEACEIQGFGLSIATAGTVSQFRIIPKDRFGNLQPSPPSPDANLEGPGNGTFQVSVLGQGRRRIMASVAQEDDGTLLASWVMTISGQYLLRVSMLDAAPSPLTSQNAVLKYAMVEDEHAREAERVLQGVQVSSEPQPFLVSVNPGHHCVSDGCGNDFCNSGSTMTTHGLTSNIALAGKPFQVTVAVRDPCGNEASGDGVAVKATIYGPLRISDPLTVFDLNPTTIVDSEPIFLFREAVIQASSWTTDIQLTRSGVYLVQVEMGGVRLLGSQQLVEVKPIQTFPRNTVLTPARNSTFSRDKVLFTVQTRDVFGNVMIAEGDVIAVSISLGHLAVGQPSFDVNIVSSTDHYSVSIENISSYGEHILQVQVNGEHIQEDPFQVTLTGGNISGATTFVTSRGGTSIPQTTPNGEQSVRFLPAVELDLLLNGRDRIGAKSRKSADQVAIQAIHESLGDITANEADLAVFRSQGPRCTDSNFGYFCETPVNATPTANYSRSVLFELIEDGRDNLEVLFETIHFSKCRSLSGFEDQETIFDNTIEFVRKINITEGNTTYIREEIEYHATSFVNFTYCRFMCVANSCTCATHINSTGTPRDGTCILLSSAFFFETVNHQDASVNTTTSIVPVKVDLSPWYLQQNELPLRYRLRCGVPGKTYLHISIGATPIQNSPFVLIVTPSILDLNVSVVRIYDQSGSLVYIAGPSAVIESVEKTAVVGGSFQLMLLAKDEFGNLLVIDALDNLYRVRVRLVHIGFGEYFKGAMTQDEHGLMVIIPNLVRKGQFSITFSQGGKEHGHLFPVFQVFSAPTLGPGQEVSFDSELCSPAACQIAFSVAYDNYGNEADLQFAFWKWDPQLDSYREHDHLDTAFTQTNQNGVSRFVFNIQTAGDFWIHVTFLDSHEVLGSPFTFSVSAGPAQSSKTTLSGPGSHGCVVNNIESSSFRIEPRDSEGNAKECAASNFNAFITDSAAQVSAVTIESGNGEELFCRARYLVSSEQPHTLTVEEGGAVIVETQLTVIAMTRPIHPASSQVLCYTRATENGPAMSRTCGDGEPATPAGSNVYLIANLRDQQLLLPDTSTEIKCSVAFCDIETSLMGSCSSGSPTSVAQFQMQEPFPGDFSWNLTLTRSGIYFVSIQKPNGSSFDSPWVVTVQPGVSAHESMIFQGSGLDKAVFLEENSFLVVDRDMYGNDRIEQEASVESIHFDELSSISLSATWGTRSVPLRVERTRICGQGLCIVGGTYQIRYWIYPITGCDDPSRKASCSNPSAEVIEMSIMTSMGTRITASISIHSRSPFVPGASLVIANAENTLYSEITVGDDVTLVLEPRTGYAIQVPLVTGRITIQSEHGRIVPTLTLRDRFEFAVALSLTVSGQYSLSILDAGAHIAGSPFNVFVKAGSPVSGNTELIGFGAYAGFVNATTSFQVRANDAFGNQADGAKVVSVQGFLSDVDGNRSLQAHTVREHEFVRLNFTFRYAGVYRLSLAINEQFVSGGQIRAGDLVSQLRSAELDWSHGTEVIAMIADTDALTSFSTGSGLTHATAGLSSQFSIFTRDAFNQPRTMGGDVFNISLNGVAAPCSVHERISRSTVIGNRYTYDARCTYTASGVFQLAISLAGKELSSSPVRLTVMPGATSPESSFLQQINPVIYFGTVGTLVVSSTSHVEDGAFIRTVGFNAFNLITLDAFGNRITHFSSSALDVKAFITAQHVRLSNGLVMWNEGEQPEGNSTASTVSSEAAAVALTMANASNGTATPSPVFEDISFEDTADYSKQIRINPDGNFEISFLATMAGKYRLHVLVNDVQIRRYVSIDEMQAVARGDVVSQAACCVPVSFGDQCPGSGSFDQVCGELITLLPDTVNVTNTVVTGQRFKQFRSEVDGDGEGHEDFPIFTIRTADRYGNYQTATSVELIVTLIDINGTVVHKEPATSIQPSTPSRSCRVSELEPTTCGTFQYEWSSITSSRSGMYMIHVSFNGSAIGPSRSYVNIRSRRPEILQSQIFGPGLQVNVGGEGSYFYFRVFDTFGNVWEPDATDDKPVNVDMGLPMAYGLQDRQKLYLDTQAATTRTKLIYHGYGLFQCQYMAWENQTNSRGNFQILYDDKKLAVPGVGRNFVPLTLGASYESSAPEPLVPVAVVSFATGSALYNHFAGDEVEVTIHALAEYPLQEFPTGYWPAVADEEGKYFVVEVQGPPGTPLRRFIPSRRAEFRWQFQVTWVPTVSGEYIVSVEYDNEPVQGDPSTPSTVMPQSPWTVHVHPAPVDPRKTVISGEGAFFAMVGALTTFHVRTRDIFNNPITSSVYNRFQGDAFVNASLLASTGPSLHAGIIALEDGTFRAEYVASRSGTYALTVMVNGVSVADVPAIVQVSAGAPSIQTTSWSVSSTGGDGELCRVTSMGFSSLEGDLEPRFKAGQILSVLIQLRDSLENVLTTGLSSLELELQVVVDGDLEYPSRTIDSRFSETLAVFDAGSHELAILLSGQHLPASPWTFEVSPSELYGPNCVSRGPGLLPGVVGDSTSIEVLGYDFYGNPTSMQDALLTFSVKATPGVLASTSVKLGYRAILTYNVKTLDEYTLSIEILGVDRQLQPVQGNGTRISPLQSEPPLVSEVAFVQAGGGLKVVFNARTDMACMYGMPHAKCKDAPTDPGLSCCHLFDADSCRALGDVLSTVPPRCWWRSPYELAVMFGSGSSVASRQVLNWQEIIRNQKGTSRLLRGTVQLQPPVRAVIPSIVFSNFAQVDACDRFELDGSLTFGNGGREMNFEWVAYQSETGSQLLSNVTQRIEVDSNIFQPGSSTIFVQATNFFNNVGGGTLPILVQAEPNLRMLVQSGVHGPVQTLRSSTLQLSSLVQENACSESSNVAFEWRVDGNRSLPLQMFGAKTTHLEVPPYTLDSGRTYQFMLTTSALIEGKLVNASGTVTVEVQPGKIHAALLSIAHQVPRSGQIILDASASVDTDASDAQFKYHWSCEPVLSVLAPSLGASAITSSDPCFYDVRGILLQDTPTLDLTGLLQPDTYICTDCIPGMYKVTVNVSKPAEGRWSVAHVIFSVTDDEASSAMAGLIPLTSRVVGTFSRLRLKGVDLFRQAGDVEYRWGLANGQDGCCLGHFDLTNSSLFPMGISQDYLILKPGLLLPGVRYAFQFSILDFRAGTTSVATLFVDVHVAPTGGSFEVEPTVGSALSTEFVITCQDWTDDPENLPLMYEFEYERGTSAGHPIGLLLQPRTIWRFPTLPERSDMTVFARVHNQYNVGPVVSTKISLFPGHPPTDDQGLIAAEQRITKQLDTALKLFDVFAVFQHADLAISLLNHLSDGPRRSHDATYNARIELRTGLEVRLRKFAFLMPKSRVTVHAMAKSLEGLTGDPDELAIGIWLQIISLCDYLASHDELVVDNEGASIALANTINNVLVCSRVQATVHPSTEYLGTAADVLVAAKHMLRRLSIAQLSHRVPEDENIILLTDEFVMNSRRVYFDTAFSSKFADFSALPSQVSTGDDGLSFEFTSHSIEMVKKQYVVRNGAFVFGTRSYPRTVYSPAGHFPKSVRNTTLLDIESAWFDSIPISQRSALRTFYLDIQVSRWRKQPFFSSERLHTQLNWGSTELGRVSSYSCSSSLTDCTRTANVCTPPVVDGSQGPDYVDVSCIHALNETSASSWAVDPDDIDDPSGAGSTIEVQFVQPFALTMIRYQPREGPKYCNGTLGTTCAVSTADCECIIGGDRLLSLTFDDGGTQLIKLNNSYNKQLFNLDPVTTSSVRIEVLSVYSNPKTCQEREMCAWWNPTCLDWCPNGAQLIEFLSTDPDPLVYNFGINYMENYSMAAAVISDLASIEVRQGRQVMQLYQTDSPINIHLPEEAHNFTRRNDTLVSCRAWDDDVRRWSGIGVLHANEDLQVSSLLHSCHAYMVAVFGLVLIENPYEPVYQTLALITGGKLQQNQPSHFLLLGITLTVLLLYILAALWVVRSRLLSWMESEMDRRVRFNEYLLAQQGGGSRVPAGEPEQTKPLSMPIYFPVLMLLQSKVVAAQDLVRGALFRLHLRKSFGRWHYLYALWTGRDEIVIFARITCLFSVILTVLALSAILISDINITTGRWYEASLQIVFTIFPLSQVFPAFFRLVSHRHESFDRFEDTDVYHGAMIEPLPVYGPRGREKKTRLKDLKKTLGPDVLYAGLKDDGMLAPGQAASTVSGTAFGDGDSAEPGRGRSTAPPDQRIPVFEDGVRSAPGHGGGRFLGDSTDPDEDAHDPAAAYPPVTTMGSIKYFVQQRRAKQRQAAALKIKANQVAAEARAVGSVLEASTEALSPSALPSLADADPSSDPSSSDAGQPGTGSDPATSDSGGAQRVVISPAATPSMKDLQVRLEPATIATLSVALPGGGEETPRQGAQLRSNTTTPGASPQQEPAAPTLADGASSDDGGPRPPPKVVVPPPPVPAGQPPRRLDHYQERTLLRRRRARELEMEVAIQSRVRRWVFALVVGRGVETWSRGTRPRDPIFFPKQFRWLCYLLCLLWGVVCMFLLFVYGAAFDLHIALAWLRLSAMSLAIELFLSQSLVAISQAVWLSYGKVWFVQEVTRWCLVRTDILPPMG